MNRLDDRDLITAFVKFDNMESLRAKEEAEVIQL